MSKTCKVQDCNRPAKCKEICMGHYNRLLIKGSVQADIPLKTTPRHGLRYTRTYRTWLMMRNRCLNLNAVDSKHYGRNGIKITPRWDIFLNFLEDMGDRPEDMTLDRIDSDKDYYKGNCRWATRTTQSRNRKYCKLNLRKAEEIRRSFALGITKIALSKKYDVSTATIRNVIRRETWDS